MLPLKHYYMFKMKFDINDSHGLLSNITLKTNLEYWLIRQNGHKNSKPLSVDFFLINLLIDIAHYFKITLNNIYM